MLAHLTPAGTVAGDFVVAGLRELDGEEHWRYTKGTGGADALSPCPTGEVVAAGRAGEHSVVVRIDERTGGNQTGDLSTLSLPSSWTPGSVVDGTPGTGG